MNRTIALVALAVVSCKSKTTKQEEPAARANNEAPAAATALATGEGIACKEGPAVADAAGVAFIDDIGGSLKVELTKEPVRINPEMHNEKAPATATIQSLALEAHAYEDDDLRPLTDAELARVVFRGTKLALRGVGRTVEHTQPDCVFTVRDVLDAVEETERQTRGESKWFGGIDVHHIYFEGLNLIESEGVWDARRPC